MDRWNDSNPLLMTMGHGGATARCGWWMGGLTSHIQSQIVDLAQPGLNTLDGWWSIPTYPDDYKSSDT